MKITIKNALAEQWPWALLVLLAGVFAGVLVGLKAPMAQQYLATSSARLAKTVVTGVDMPCTATSLPALLKSTDWFAQPASTAANPDLMAASIVPQRMGAALAGADLVQITYVDGSDPGARARAQWLAQSLSQYCEAATVSSYRRYNLYLVTQKANRDREIVGIDRSLIPATDAATLRDQLKKRQDDLKTQITALQSQATAQEAVANTKSAALAALLPAAKEFNEQSDALFKTMQAQLEKDQAALSTMKAHYKPAYPALQAFDAKVTSEEEQLNAYRTTLDAKPPELDPAYRAAQATADDAKAAVLATQSQLAGTQDALKSVTAQLGTIPASGALSAGMAAVARHKAELVKQYQALSAQFGTALTEEAAIPLGGPLVVLPQPAFAPRVGLLVAALLGLLTVLAFAVLALLLAVLLNVLDRRLLTVRSITKLYGKPVIATVPPKR
jgi:hypothetical protein